VTKIFETLNIANNGSMNDPNVNSPVMNGSSERLAGSRATQTAYSGVAVSDEEAPRTVAPALEMDLATRQELTKLTHRLFLSSGGSRVVAFSGVEAGVGCSWILARVAQLLANADAGSVCIVDADLSNPIQHRYFRVGNGSGLSDALMHSHPIEEYLKRVGGGLHLLSSGSAIPKAETLFSSSAFRLRVEELRARFDFLLFDTPPMATSSNALEVASRAQGLAMVVEANSTNRETAVKVAKEAAAANVHLMGAVLNKRTFPIPEAIYNRL